jgi:signal transduction histidine kinase
MRLTARLVMGAAAVVVASAGEVARPAGITARLLDVAAGAAFLGCGTAAVGRPEQRRFGVFAYAGGVAWFAGNLMPGLLFVHRPVLVHAALAYPSGRLQGPVDLALVVALWADAVVLPAAGTPQLTLALAVAVAVRAGRLVGRPGAADQRNRSVAGRATLVLALAMGLPAAARLAAPSSATGPTFALAYAALVALAGVMLCAGVLRDARRTTGLTDAVIELTDKQPLGSDPVAALEAAARRSGWDLGPSTAVALEAAADLVAANRALHTDLELQVAEVRASRRRLVEAADIERDRLEQRLAGSVGPLLDEVRRLLYVVSAEATDEATRTLAARGRQEVAAAQADLEDLARGLHPRLLAEQGLAVALDDLAGRVGVPTSVAAPTSRFEPGVEIAAWYACAEAMANVAKHAAATSAVIDVHEDGSALVAVVEDDGVGGARLSAVSGLAGLADRLGAVGGSLVVASGQPSGTRLEAHIPLARS